MVFQSLKSLFSGNPSAPSAEVFDSQLAPDAPFVAVGDLHGRIDLLDQLSHQLWSNDTDMPVVFLGDYVDRGPNSAAVLDRLRQWQAIAPEKVICLKGNHEKMMCEFLDDPLGRGARWLRFGGRETLESFGVNAPDANAEEDAEWAAEKLAAVMPAGLRNWLDDLPLIWRSGNIACVHAGMDPNRDIDHQSERALLWGHRDFFKTCRDDGHWVVHGHTIVRQPSRSGGRISIDTGAFATGHLTAAFISAGDCRFVST